MAPGTLRGSQGRQGENGIERFCCCPAEARGLTAQKARTGAAGKVPDALGGAGREMPLRGWMKSHPRSISAGIIPSISPHRCILYRGRAISPCWRSLPAPQGAHRGAHRGPQAAQPAPGALSFPAHRTRGAAIPGGDAAAFLPRQSLSPFRVPGYLCVTHALPRPRRAPRLPQISGSVRGSLPP